MYCKIYPWILMRSACWLSRCWLSWCWSWCYLIWIQVMLILMLIYVSELCPYAVVLRYKSVHIHKLNKRWTLPVFFLFPFHFFWGFFCLFFFLFFALSLFLTFSFATLPLMIIRESNVDSRVKQETNNKTANCCGLGDSENRYIVPARLTASQQRTVTPARTRRAEQAPGLPSRHGNNAVRTCANIYWSS